MRGITRAVMFCSAIAKQLTMPLVWPASGMNERHIPARVASTLISAGTCSSRSGAEVLQRRLLWRPAGVQIRSLHEGIDEPSASV